MHRTVASCRWQVNVETWPATTHLIPFLPFQPFPDLLLHISGGLEYEPWIEMRITGSALGGLVPNEGPCDGQAFSGKDGVRGVGMTQIMDPDVVGEVRGAAQMRPVGDHGHVLAGISCPE